MGTKFKPTDEQVAVIEHEGSHALVNAVAGAGKSSTLVEHIARRVQLGADPRRIVAIQYNKAAQLSMQRKLKDRLEGIDAPQARTFHSIGNAMLKRLVEVGAMPAAKFESDPSVYADLQRRALRQAWKNAYGSDAYPSQDQIEGFSQFVTRVKADIRPASDVFRTAGYNIDCQPYIASIQVLDHLAAERKVYFFDDMLANTYSCLLAQPGLWSLFRDRLELVAVDEFQDINPVQYALLFGIVGSRAECMAIGDPDQAIYRFRGSDPAFINEHFVRDYEGTRVYRLTNTFRYGHETALLANHVITNNTQRDNKISVAAPGNPDTRVIHLPQKPGEPSGLITHLEPAFRDGSLRHHAVLVRYYSQSVPYEIELAAAGIPFHVYGREPLALIPEIACLIGAMSLAEDYWVIPNALQERFLSAMVHAPSIFATKEVLRAAGIAMANAMAHGQPISEGLFNLASSANIDNTRLRERLRDRANVIRLMEAGGLRGKPPSKVIEAYLNFTSFRQHLASSAASDAQAAEIEQNLNAFLNMASSFASTTELLDVLGPLAGHEQNKPPQGDHLAILSMHRSKGLEWHKVYLPGWSALTFPRQHEEIEEERRLAYVAITRAVDELVLMYPDDPTLDATNRVLHELPEKGASMSASKFLYEAEIGLSAAAADAIRTQRPLSIAARREDVVNRYAKESGFPYVSAKVPPDLAQRMRQTSVNQRLVVEPGNRLRQGNQLYKVTQQLGERYYYVSPLAGGDPRLISLDEPGWTIEPD